jgi:hypothetical protein
MSFEHKKTTPFLWSGSQNDDYQFILKPDNLIHYPSIYLFWIAVDYTSEQFDQTIHLLQKGKMVQEQPAETLLRNE